MEDFDQITKIANKSLQTINELGQEKSGSKAKQKCVRFFKSLKGRLVKQV